VVAGGAWVVVVTGLGFFTALWVVVVVVVVVAGSAVVVRDVVVVAGVEAAGVDVLLGVVPPPQPATASATAIALNTIFFIGPAPVLAFISVLSGYKTPRAPVCSGRTPTELTIRAFRRESALFPRIAAILGHHRPLTDIRHRPR
jgi:hypothetical protein